MKGTWVDFLSMTRGFFARNLIIAAGVCCAIVLGTASPIRAETFPVTGTAGFETGLRNLAFVTLDKGEQGGHGARVNWGDGTPVQPGLYRCFEPLRHPNRCHVFGTHRYAAPGTYTIAVHYNEPQFFGTGDEVRETTTATISPIGDFVILSIGDSVASGEGNPVVQFGGAGSTQPNQGFWDNPGSNYDSVYVGDLNTQEERNEFGRKNCHRSLIGGPAQAVGLVGTTNPVTFVHFACSGAAVGQIGIPKEDPERSNIIEQLRIARKHLERIDVLLISGGFNNMIFRSVNYNNTGVVRVGFGALVVRCLFPDLDPFDLVGIGCEEDLRFRTDINDSINGNPDRILPGRAEKDGQDIEYRFPGLHRAYQDLDKEIHCINPADDTPEPDCSETQIPKLVLITEFFDPTHDETGNFKDGCLSVPAARWAYISGVITDVNRQVHLSPWPAVVGIQDDFLKHGLCADSDNRWVVRPAESFVIQNDKNGTGHPNGAGHANYRDHIHARMVELNPPVTTASATVGGVPYPFGTWTGQDVEMTLSAKNLIKEAGVKQTFYAVDNPNCNFADVSDDPANPPNCLLYGGPFTISTSGKHTVTFFSLNAQGHPEAVQSVQVWVDQNPPLSSVPDTMTIFQGQSASYTITVGHLGWAGQTIDLSCTTDAELAACVMLPTSVTLDATNSNASVATVITTLGSAVLKPPAPPRSTPFGPFGALRLLLAFATAAFLAAMARALRRHRWAQVTHFAALALLFGVLCAGCNGGGGIPGTPQGTHTVTITGTSGMTSNTVQVKLVVQ